MIAFIGPYTHHFSVASFCENKLRFSEPVADKVGDLLQPVVNIFWNSWWTKLSNFTYIKPSYHDTWDASVTIAKISLPLLRMLKEGKRGAPTVENEDVPQYLHRSLEDQESYDTDENWFKRWEYVMGEVIFALESIVDPEWEDQFHSGIMDIYFEKCENPPGCSEMKRGPKDTHVFDKAGHDEYQARISNGLRLFGVYFQGFWD